ncbi:MAG: phosphatidate cytidylyltransferase [Candidatus Bathyarchaeota archaeon]|nr:phosphatidate cytidylyltransferase [Candidatus Bathyarchaeota archaeon]
MDELLWNLTVMVGCYAYIVALIVVSPRLRLSGKVSRKVLHAMIGNLPLIMPFFTASIYPFLVASPFILVTLLATPNSPIKLGEKMKGLSSLTEEGHHWGLVLYAISYSALALLFGVKPYVVAAGIFPMAYGDSLAAIFGEYYGKHKYRVFETKSLEGSLGMFLGSFVSLTLAFLYFGLLYPFTFNPLVPAFAIAGLAAVVEGISPKGLDNVAVPLVGAATFLFLTGGI